ncbi:MAG TPA: HAMP domain-containing sensor histidine kinase [Candidatus Paceibacterota bacterium]|nr:HAMP domain-containing sensor histidine kinase [Candidatus Paceibacterota bacterium]
MANDAELKKIEQENQRLAQLCSMKSEMVSLNAHQIKTSLSAQKWIIKMFLDGDLGALTPEQENLMQKAYESNDRAIELVSDMLADNKKEELAEKKFEFSPVDLSELIDSVKFDFSGEAYSHGVEMIFLHPEEDIPPVDADKEKMRMVLQNLLDNAIKYSGNHGKVFITLSKKDDQVQVSVKDTGVGISPEGQKHIFEKFYRDPEAEKKEITGSGIGLFTAKNVVERHGGKIWFESRPEAGTTFFFTIPIRQKGGVA